MIGNSNYLQADCQKNNCCTFLGGFRYLIFRTINQKSVEASHTQKTGVCVCKEYPVSQDFFSTLPTCYTKLLSIIIITYLSELLDHHMQIVGTTHELTRLTNKQTDKSKRPSPMGKIN